MMALQSIYFGDKILFTLSNKNLENRRRCEEKKNYIYFFIKKKYLVIKLFLYNFLENNNNFCHLKINIVVIFYTILIIYFFGTFSNILNC